MNFTRDMLVAGKHVIECADGERLLVLHNDFALGLDEYLDLSEANDKMEFGTASCSVVAVYEVLEPTNLKTLLDPSVSKEILNLVWPIDTSKQAKLDEIALLKQELLDLVQKINDLQDSL